MTARIKFIRYQSSFQLSSIIAIALLLSSNDIHADKKPTLSVFAIQDKGVGLTRSTISRFSDFFSAQIASMGFYNTVSREQIKKELKRKGLKRCKDRACRILISNKLQAKYSLSTSISKLGSKCIVTAVLLSNADDQEEGGASVEGICDEDSLASSVKALAEKIGKRKVTAKKPGAEVPPLPPTVEPPPLPQNGSAQPPPVSPPALRPTSSAPPPVRRDYRSSRPTPTNERPKNDRYTKTEWFGFRGLVGGGMGGFWGGGEFVIATLRWKKLYLEIMRLGGGYPGWFHWGPAIGYPIHLGNDGKNELRIGGHLTFFFIIPTMTGLQFSYLRHFSRNFALEVGIIQYSYPFSGVLTIGFKI